MEGRIQEYVNSYLKTYKEFIRETIIDDSKTNNQKLENIFVQDT